MKKTKNIMKKILIIIITINLIVFSGTHKNMFVYSATEDDASLIGQILAYAEQWVGVTPYVSKGNSLITGTDCSGFVKLVYAQFGFNLPRTTKELRNVGTPVTWEQIQPGDVIVTLSAQSQSGYHTGIYIGDGKWINCPATGRYVEIVEFPLNYWTIDSIRRIVGAVASDGSIPPLYPDNFGPGLFSNFTPQGEVDPGEIDLDSLLDFEFAGSPSKVDYTDKGAVKIQWLFSKLSQFIDYILGVSLTGLRGSIVGWTDIIEGWFNSALRQLSGK